MNKTVFCSLATLLLASGTHLIAKAPGALDQLTAQAPERQAAALPEARAEETKVVITEKGQPVRTIYFELDAIEKGNPFIDAFFGNNGNNNGHNNGYGSYGRVNCTAQDLGWEEHWGGHGGGPSELRACQECLQSHGDCRFNCSVEQFRCTAQFNPAVPAVVPGQPQPSLPAPSTFTGDLRQDQGSAQDSATLRCMQATQGQQGYCSVTGCNRENQVVRSGRCRK